MKLTRRVEMRLTEEDYRELAEEAERRGSNVATVGRERIRHRCFSVPEPAQQTSRMLGEGDTK